MIHAPCVAITRPAESAQGLVALLRAAGIRALVVPAIRRGPPTSFAALDRAVEGISSYQGVLFTSPAAVEAFFERAPRFSREGLVIGAVGTGTAAALQRRGVTADVVPEEGSGEALAGELISTLGARVRQMRFLQPRAADGREELYKGLVAAGAGVDVVDAYRTEPATEAELAPLLLALQAGAVDAVIFASPSAVDAVLACCGLGKAAAVAIGRTTAASLWNRGVGDIFVAQRPDDEGLLQAVREALGARR